MNAKNVFLLLLLIVAVAGISLVMHDRGGLRVGNSGSKAVSQVTIFVPQDYTSYDAAMNDFIFEGRPDPSFAWPFDALHVKVATTTDVLRASAQAAADYIETQGGKEASHIVYFKIQNGAAYVLLAMHRNGWAGVSATIAKIEPLISKTLLHFPEITSVKFGIAPGDSENSIQ